MNNQKSKKDNVSPQIKLNNLMKLYWEQNPYIKDSSINHELEIRFGLLADDDKVKELAKKNIYIYNDPLSKIDYENVIGKLKSLGFSNINNEGDYKLRIQNEYIHPRKGTFMTSNIRTEINGYAGIQSYCKNNSIKALLDSYKVPGGIQFYRKEKFRYDNKPIPPIYFNDFNFRVGYNKETMLKEHSGIIRDIVDTWDKSKKIFRYLNRITMTHPDIPINVDLSIVKTSSNYKLAYTTTEARLFESNETIEIELEIDNNRIGPGTGFDSAEKVLLSLRKSIKYILMGLQGTNYPVSYPELHTIELKYMKLIHNRDYSFNYEVVPKNFIGPSSSTLQIKNVAPINENAKFPNIRDNYTVTDKADGARNMLYISNKGLIYLISSSMNIMFSGAKTLNNDLFNTLLDGELISHDKYGKYINLYAAFDIYFINKEDVRSYNFIPENKDDTNRKFRLDILKDVIKNLKPTSIIENEISPIRIDSKTFYPTYSESNIFEGCNTILSRIKEGLFEYNTDGLIFTPANLGIGKNRYEKENSIYKKSTWNSSFKWKPPEYNTIDFLCTTEKVDGKDKISYLYQDGINTSQMSQIDQYKTIQLRCGFNENRHGYINPCQDVLDDNVEVEDKKEREKKYDPVQFYPSNPPDENAGITNIMLRRDDSGVNQMYTEENEIFEDNTIVECRYEIDNDEKWRWIPLRVRYDKTSELRRGIKNYGNDYNVANSNWHSIHNPITEYMLMTGNNIPDEIANDEVYYNRLSRHSDTKLLRNFHNLYVKKLLITSVSRTGDSLIDYAVGPGGDISKWKEAQLSFVFGIDVSPDNIENRISGACARYLTERKDFENIPRAIFLIGDSAKNIRSGQAMETDKGSRIARAIFGNGPTDVDSLGKNVKKLYGKGEEGFNVSSCQFATHYFFKDMDTLQGFMRNVAECTKLNGYFIGTCYDGNTIFNLLKNKEINENINIYNGKNKIWEIVKKYEHTEYPANAQSLGYEIDVYQDSINKTFPEWLVNYDYLLRIMENYGFQPLTRKEAQDIGLPNSTGLFSELFALMENEIEKNPSLKNKYGNSQKMESYEKKISFLNRYFVFKKVMHVNTQKIVLETEEDIIIDKEVEAELSSDEEEYKNEKEKEQEIEKEIEEKTDKLETDKSKEKKNKKSTKKSPKKPIKKLSKKIILQED